jgi:nitrogen regulatory protein PII
MALFSAVIRPCRLNEVKQALLSSGAEFVTVTEVEGFGRQKGHTVQYQGVKYKVDSISKLIVNAMIPNDMCFGVAMALTNAARTNHIGDGKIFMFSNVTEVVGVSLAKQAIQETVL